MPTLADLEQKVSELQTSIDTEQQQVADLLAQKEATITSLNSAITDLQVLVAAGGTETERQAVLDKLVAAKDDIESTVA